MRVLVACEYSGKVRDAFRKLGHDAWSCDLLATTSKNNLNHFQCDVREILYDNWDLVVAHPECTYHTNSGVRWFTTIPKTQKPGTYYGAARWDKWREAVAFFKLFQNLGDSVQVVIENPIPHCYSTAELGHYTQLIHPWQFGHKEMKATALWLYGLDPLVPTDIVGPPPKDPAKRKAWQRVHNLPPSADRWQLRSTTFDGIADAFGQQYGGKK